MPPTLHARERERRQRTGRRKARSENRKFGVGMIRSEHSVRGVILLDRYFQPTERFVLCRLLDGDGISSCKDNGMQVWLCLHLRANAASLVLSVGEKLQPDISSKATLQSAASGCSKGLAQCFYRCSTGCWADTAKANNRQNVELPGNILQNLWNNLMPHTV